MAAAAALADPVRRDLYRFLARHGSPATRDEVAAATGMSRRAAAFHLDTLLDAGALRVSYARPPGRNGPGAGRPAKRYAVAGDLAVSIPDRRYENAARMLMAAVEEAGAKSVATRIAEQRGKALGRDVAPAEPDPDRALEVALAVLARQGYDPVRSEGAVLPRNCPFDALARNGELVCEMNRHYVAGLAESLGLRARDVRDAGCCAGIVADSFD